MNILNCNIRVKNSRHDAGRIRRMGKVPGVLYGEQVKNLLFEIGEMELSREIVRQGEHGVIDVNIEGTTHRTLIKEVQKDPVTHKIIHIDLEGINPDKTIQTSVPIHFINEDKVAQSGGILQKEKSSVKIQCKASKLPKYINVDLKNLKFGDVFKLSNIELASEITFMEDVNTVIATVTGGNTNEATTSAEDASAPTEI
ncbi:50S ribosomal protein L25 [Clostridium thermarum]|uniref:50S ribosomal protein L25 n=1 Tax=Clostridium thermarum TaxID=1716543 RepID=UPI0011242323|nr:50S ribosomal protein L25 [Clostridium thermarum]